MTNKTSELAINDSEVLALFKDDAQLGMEDMGQGGSIPILTLLGANSNVIKNDEKDTSGNDLKIGRFFHSETRIQYEKLEANILYIKEAQLPKFQKPGEFGLNYVIGGIIRDESKAPFIMYIKGMSLSSFFAFKTDLQKLTSNKQQPIPMYALIVRIEKEVKESKGFGKVNTTKLTIVRSENGFPMIETDKDALMWLRSGYERVKGSINSLLEKRDEEAVQAVDGEIEDGSDDLPFG